MGMRQEIGNVGHIHKFDSSAASAEIMRTQRMAYMHHVRFVCSCPLGEVCYAQTRVSYFYFRRSWAPLRMSRG